jgi:release factor glutamine methyltransferase
VTLQEALREGIHLLEQEGVPEARLAAELLLMHAAAGDRTLLYTHPERELGDLARLHYGRYLHERLQGRPTQYITGRQEFWGLEFQVNPSVLIPRPETEHVVERALQIAECGLRIADCGTGSGCIAIALAKEMPEAKILAGDISFEALAVAADNARRLGVGQRVHFFCADLLACFPGASLDIVVSNPPYVATADAATLAREVREFEPHQALFAGEEGLAVYRRLIPEAARVLRPGGWAVFELGYNVAEPVRQLFTPGWEEIAIMKDLAGIDRVISARRAPP